jgi:mRNA-degrading endonuclease RelE of RelBE toxin-antitoxin system
MRETWSVDFMPDAWDALRKMDRQTARRIVERLMWLAEHVHEVFHQPLHGEWAGCFKLRVGDLLEHETCTVVVHLVGHRSSIYKRRQ